jgi:hypothetical protein
MKYRDIRFEKHRDKQVFGDFEKSSRQIKRERIKLLDKFYRCVLSGLLSRLYWDNLSDSDKDSIIDRWGVICIGYPTKGGISFKRANIEFRDWIMDNYVVDKVGYRDDVLKVLGI